MITFLGIVFVNQTSLVTIAMNVEKTHTTTRVKGAPHVIVISMDLSVKTVMWLVFFFLFLIKGYAPRSAGGT